MSYEQKEKLLVLKTMNVRVRPNILSESNLDGDL